MFVAEFVYVIVMLAFVFCQFDGKPFIVKVPPTAFVVTDWLVSSDTFVALSIALAYIVWVELAFNPSNVWLVVFVAVQLPLSILY